ncbi:uncharacterized protein F5Z01DRAFT_681509 [Emericellopsis atlantica]|uniref:DUF2252 domain-containing protein n=1 Tax=Emericellopsis atlantica TaxID=2614577 RepID=A0A9P7ZMP7_9HYPO|nr:uncharacterized protein F5Z01DRAFT_681509 [Emericellopsis atlantica]KAG9254496.1 hypothetical protein F5Z01DRAFT_681509 [Emericellopsis atlantica]
MSSLKNLVHKLKSNGGDDDDETHTHDALDTLHHHDASDGQRAKEILSVFEAAFGTLTRDDPDAMGTKFRKMAASAFAFYRGTAALFYHDMARASGSAAGDRFLNEQTSHIWMHGDLHAENFGTYMDAHGHLIFNVNDFDEAYVGPFTWDLKRFVASIALIGYSKALSDRQVTKLVTYYVRAYRERIGELARGKEDVKAFTLRNATGPVLEALRSARLQSRVELLDSMTEIHEHDRRFIRGQGGAFELEEATRKSVVAGFDQYLTTLPTTGAWRRGSDNPRIKDVVGRRGMGIGSAGLPNYNILLEGRSEALENDVVLYVKQSQPAAVAKHIEHNVAQAHFHHEGHRTVVSQRALQAHADPWLGWTEIDGQGHMVAEVSPHEVDLEWSDIDRPGEMASVVADLGRATAMMHGAGDDDARHSDLVPFSPEKVIDEAIAADEQGFVGMLVAFARDYSTQVRKDHHIFTDLFRNGAIPGLPDSDDL